MIIEFADPGYNWWFLWWPLIAIGIAIVISIIIGAIWEEEAAPVAGFLISSAFFAVLIGPLAFGLLGYDSQVSDAKESALTDLGFEHVEVSGDSFTASFEGAYFSGTLVNLKPESGYRYEVFELSGASK